MWSRGSWCGETHLQKATFFLQELLNVGMDFEFILYRHGPFSFDLHDELVVMQADELLQLTSRRYGYGPSYVPTQFSETFLSRFPNTTTRYSAEIEFIADELRNKGVAELEKLATAFFIVKREGFKGIDKRSRRLVELKPHVSMFDARRANEEIDAFVERARRFSVSEQL
jgi:hypothetical protein